MNIEVELIAQAQDDADTTVGELTAAVSCVHFRLRKAVEAQMATCRAAAIRVANSLGWELYDPQLDAVVTAGSRRNSWRRFW